VIRRLYVHNFRCLENFELPISGQSSVLLIGKNGSGKTTVGLALEILQKIARGTNRIADLVKPKDLARGRADVPMRFEIEVELEAQLYKYTIAFAIPKSHRETELFVLEEKLEVGGRVLYTRAAATLHVETRDAAATPPALFRVPFLSIGVLRLCQSFRNSMAMIRFTFSNNGSPGYLSFGRCLA